MKIGIFTAMQKEAASFLQGEFTQTKDGDFDVYFFKLANSDAVLCCPPSVGEIAAAAACQLLITKYQVDCIINFGVVGALTQSVALADFVLVGDVVHYDMDTSQVDNRPKAYYEYFDSISVACSQELLAKAKSIANYPVVRCASADKFVGNADEKTVLNKDYGADICDMESAGILFTCKFNNVPCLMIKCISDSLFGSHDEYFANVYRITNGFFDMARKLVQGLERAE